MDRLRTEHVKHNFPRVLVNIQTQPSPFCNIIFKPPCIVFEVLGDIPRHWLATIREEGVVPVTPWPLLSCLHFFMPACDNAERGEGVPGIQNPGRCESANAKETAKRRP